MEISTKPGALAGARACRFTQGFSLIEVTIALGVVSFALIALFGLLPTGLTTFRSSIDRSVASQIAQGILSNARQTEFTNLSALAATNKYTDEGDDTTDVDKTIYVAIVDVYTNVLVPATPAFTNPGIAKISVRVAKSPGGSLAPFTSNSTSVQQFSAFIPKM